MLRYAGENIEVFKHVYQHTSLGFIFDTRMIKKIETPQGNLYKFFHSSFKEFLAAVHLFVTGEGVMGVSEHEQLREAIPFFSELQTGTFMLGSLR